jgi:hypothetical protein
MKQHQLWPFPKAKKIHWFRKGEQVPEWVLRVAKPLLQTRLKFGMDVVVEQDDPEIHAYPENSHTDMAYVLDSGTKSINKESIFIVNTKGRRVNLTVPHGKILNLHNKKYGTKP